MKYKKIYVPLKPYWGKHNLFKEINKEEREERYMDVVGGMLYQAMVDLGTVPDSYKHNKEVMQHRKDSTKGWLKTKHFEWWCELIEISSARVKRLIFKGKIK